MSYKSDKLESMLKTLQKVAERYPKESDELGAIKLAAEALLFIKDRDYIDDFENYVNESSLQLTEAQIAHLKSMGLPER